MRKLITLTLFCLVFPLPVILWAAPDEPVFGPGERDTGTELDTIVAIVDDDVITRSELDSAIASIERQFQQRGTTLPPHDVLGRQVLERLIITQLELRAAERNGIVVDDQSVNAALEEIARQNRLSLSELRQAIEADGFSFAKFRDDIRKELIATRLRQKVVDSQIQISEHEVDNFLASNRGKQANQEDSEYHLAQILIGVPENPSPKQIEAARSKALEVLEQLRQGSDFKRLAVTVSDGRQALEGGDLGWRRADQLPTLFADLVPRLQVGQVSELISSPSGFHIVKLLEVKGAQQKTITQTRARHILIASNDKVSDSEASERLERLRERVLNGEDFGELARANSSDTNSAIKGGELGWVGPGDLVHQFQEQLDKLQPGEVSEPFKTPFGWHIVQVLERREHDSSDESQRAEAREALFKRKSEEEWDQWLRRLRDEAYVEIRLS